MTHAEPLIPRLERQLVLAAAGDANACRRLVEVFLPAIASVAYRFPVGAGIERRELLQEGVVGLLFAVRRYDPRWKTPFWFYASFWVRKRMQELVSELARPVALSDRAVRNLARLKAAHREHLHVSGSEPTNEQLGEATGLTPVQVERLQAAGRAPRGMEERLNADAEAATVGDSIIDPLAERAYEEVLERMEIRALQERADLDERERAVIGAHYGLNQPEQTLEEIGGALGLTAERARQIEAGALAKLRNALP